MDEQQVPTPHQASNEKIPSNSFRNNSSALLHNHNNSDFISRASRRNDSRLFSARSKDQQSSIRSIKIEDKESQLMEEDDTYRVFVNDDPVSTRKALNSRLDKLSGQHTPPKERSSATISSGVREQHDFVTAKFPQKA